MNRGVSTVGYCAIFDRKLCLVLDIQPIGLGCLLFAKVPRSTER